MVNVGGLQIGPEHPVRIMGVVNLSPESFYKESIVEGTNELQMMLERLISEGADIVDIGGASTAPKNVYSTSDVTRDEEIKRISSALGSVGDVKRPISIDTTSAVVAEVALDLGASVVNDISGFKADPKMTRLVADREVPVILMANCFTPCGSVQESLAALKTSLKLASDGGIDSEKIILDPGIGFGKPPDVDFAILSNLEKFVTFGYPLLVGVSRKAFIGDLLEQSDPEDRLMGTIAANSIAAMKGASILRAHDVREAKIAARIGKAIQMQHE
ncbi:MAG: dihydropteroate synthase [Candidatus Thorarchaeota archaeon]